EPNPKSEKPSPRSSAPSAVQVQEKTAENAKGRGEAFGFRISNLPPGLAHYYVVCLVSMSVIWLVLLLPPLPAAATLFPIPMGILGIAVRWRLAPVVLLVTLAICLKFESTYESPRTFRVSDLILCAATLAFIAAQFRLQSMYDHIVPVDPRR